MEIQRAPWTPCPLGNPCTVEWSESSALALSWRKSAHLEVVWDAGGFQDGAHVDRDEGHPPAPLDFEAFAFGPREWDLSSGVGISFKGFR